MFSCWQSSLFKKVKPSTTQDSSRSTDSSVSSSPGIVIQDAQDYANELIRKAKWETLVMAENASYTVAQARQESIEIIKDAEKIALEIVKDALQEADNIVYNADMTALDVRRTALNQHYKKNLSFSGWVNHNYE